MEQFQRKKMDIVELADGRPRRRNRGHPLGPRTRQVLGLPSNRRQQSRRRTPKQYRHGGVVNSLEPKGESDNGG